MHAKQLRDTFNGNVSLATAEGNLKSYIQFECACVHVRACVLPPPFYFNDFSSLAFFTAAV